MDRFAPGFGSTKPIPASAATHPGGGRGLCVFPMPMGSADANGRWCMHAITPPHTDRIISIPGVLSCRSRSTGPRTLRGTSRVGVVRRVRGSAAPARPGSLRHTDPVHVSKTRHDTPGAADPRPKATTPGDPGAGGSHRHRVRPAGPVRVGFTQADPAAPTGAGGGCSDDHTPSSCSVGDSNPCAWGFHRWAAHTIGSRCLTCRGMRVGSRLSRPLGRPCARAIGVAAERAGRLVPDRGG